MTTFQEFLKASGKKKINLTLVGHSLGAGAASIAGMELHDRKDFNVQVFGFGCPALLSKGLSESTQDYITTVVADNDCIPRMSLSSMMNAILDIGEYNWIHNAQQDLEDVIDQVQSALPAYITDSVKKNLLEILRTKVLSVIDIPPPTQERMDPILFPRKLIEPNTLHTMSFCSNAFSHQSNVCTILVVIPWQLENASISTAMGLDCQAPLSPALSFTSSM